jgi:hypothetical protein
VVLAQQDSWAAQAERYMKKENKGAVLQEQHAYYLRMKYSVKSTVIAKDSNVLNI